MRQDVSIAVIHRAADRRNRYRSAPAIIFDQRLRSWVVIDPTLAGKALTDERLLVVDYRGATRALAEASGVPLDNALFALGYIPIASDGDSHTNNRKAVARHLASRRKAIETAVIQAIAEQATKFGQPGELEVMTEVLMPLVNVVIGAISGVPIDPSEEANDTSRIFDRLLGIRWHQRIDRKIGESRIRVRDSIGNPHSEAEEGVPLSLWILGYDALLGTLGEGLHHAFQTHHGSRLSDIRFADNPPETGVPFLARIAAEDLEFASAAITKGDRIRIMLQTSAYSEDSRQQGRIFGAGSHACLGRPLSLDIWRMLTEKIGRSELTLDYLGSELRDQDYLFVFPTNLRIRLRA